MYNVIIRGKDFHPTATSLKAMLEEWWWAKVENRVNHEIIDVATRVACAEMLKNGITCMDDILEAPNSVPGCLGLEASILEKAGMRGVCPWSPASASAMKTACSVSRKTTSSQSGREPPTKRCAA